MSNADEFYIRALGTFIVELSIILCRQTLFPSCQKECSISVSPRCPMVNIISSLKLILAELAISPHQWLVCASIRVCLSVLANDAPGLF